MSGDNRLLSVVRVAGEAFDPLPAGMVARLHFAVSLELMQAELATLQLDGLATVRALAPLAVTTVTFTATTISLMVTFEDTADGVRRLDHRRRRGGGAPHGPRPPAAGERRHWPSDLAERAHGRVRFLIAPGGRDQRLVVTPAFEV